MLILTYSLTSDFTIEVLVIRWTCSQDGQGFTDYKAVAMTPGVDAMEPDHIPV